MISSVSTLSSSLSSTIASLATPAGISGIAVVRISGPNALSVAQKLSGKRKKVFKPRYALYTPLFSPRGLEIDSGVLTFFPSPHSYTGEDVLELSCHGGVVVANELLDACFSLGCVPAHPGEFTRRAFMNGKIDLCQAEAVAGVIMSESSMDKEVNYKILTGRFSDLVLKLKSSLFGLVTILEAELDFTDDEIKPTPQKDKAALVSLVLSQTKEVLSTYTTGRVLHRGALVALVGKPNVGKSSLLNAILSEERTIVSENPGTTRDAVEVPFLINNFPVRLVDTAGLGKPNSAVEGRGMDFTRNYVNKADLLLNVVDISQPKTAVKKDIINSDNQRPVIHVLNKCDLLNNGPSEQWLSMFPNVSITSALCGDGVDDLLRSIYKRFVQRSALVGGVVLTNARHKLALDGVAESLERALYVISSNESSEILAVELRGALFHLDEILGITTVDDILDNIFSNFCIGK